MPCRGPEGKSAQDEPWGEEARIDEKPPILGLGPGATERQGAATWPLTLGIHRQLRPRENARLLWHCPRQPSSQGTVDEICGLIPVLFASLARDRQSHEKCLPSPLLRVIAATIVRFFGDIYYHWTCTRRC